MTDSELKKLNLDQVLQRIQSALSMAKELKDSGLLVYDPNLIQHCNFRLELGDFIITSRFPDWTVR